jgi:hypothetical protein
MSGHTPHGMPTQEDWAAIHKKAFNDPKFHSLFETDPTAAIKQYAAEAKKTFTKIVSTEGWIDKSKPYVATRTPPVSCC